MDLAPRSPQPVPRSGSHPLAATGSQSDRLAAGIGSETAGRAGGGNGAAQPHQLPLPPAEGIRRRTAQTWAATHAGVLGGMPVAYFSAEFGIHESIPIYSGGLGVLSGDHIKSASGLGVPLVGVGLFYSQGYFKPAAERRRLPARRVPGHQGREPADGTGRRRGRPADHRGDRHPQRRRCTPRSG